MKKISIFFASTLMLALLFTHCGKDSNPVDPSDSDHLEAVGCVVKQGDVEVIRAEKGAVTGAFTVEERVQSSLYNLYLISESGALFQPEDDDYVFAWESKNPQTADIIQFETDGLWGFHVKGFDPGQTSLVLKVLHGEHEDFVSLDVPVTVTASTGGGLGKK